MTCTKTSTTSPRTLSSKRIHRIKCYNVGFGDCFLCKDADENGSKMLVDFGGAQNFDAVKPDLLREFSTANKKYLMLSHLHCDHYSGLKKISAQRDKRLLQFDEIYIPDYIGCGGIEFLGELLLSTKSTYLLRLVRSILKIPDLLSGYITDDTKVHLLCQGNTISNTLCDFEVILPLQSNPFYAKKQELYEDAIHTFASEYKNLVRYHDEQQTRGALIHLHHGIGERIDSLINNLLEVATDAAPLIDDDMLKDAFKDYHNSLSLAFHELSVDDSQNVLFLGDAVPTDISRIKTSFNERYCFVKVQHHGTKNHFSRVLPTAQYYAISNGGARNGWGITSLYDKHYGKHATFVCSNNINCDCIKCESRSKNHAVCGIAPLSETIDIP